MTERLSREFFRKKGLEGAKKLRRKYGKAHYTKMARARWDKQKKESTDSPTPEV